ncbi:hypothetical protein [Nostoc sp. CMAA1605]|nr:hypothetical protein [Nostoc sp. CMAA1605]
MDLSLKGIIRFSCGGIFTQEAFPDSNTSDRDLETAQTNGK